MSTFVGKGYIHGMATGALACSTLTGYASPKIETLRATHNGNIDRVAAQATGDTEGLIAQDEKIECTFDVIAEGSTIANAKEAVGLPALLAAFTTTGFPVIEVGSFSDVLNVTSGDPGGNPWIYEGGGTINGFLGAKWTATIPLVRYRRIASATVIAA